MWNDTAFTRRFERRFPIVQGPFGGGLSSPRLAATVSEAGGLGSFGAQGMTPDRIRAVVAEIRALTSEPFAVNLWVSTADARAEDVTRADYDAAVAVLAPLYAELGVTPPPFPPHLDPGFDEQVDRADRGAAADLQLHLRRAGAGDPRVAVVRWGSAPSARRRPSTRRARSMRPASMRSSPPAPKPAVTGRRSSRSAEASLMGTVALVPQAADAVRTPIIAAGGIADGRGVAAALALGAAAVQIGTAFLACDESNAHPTHRAALARSRAGRRHAADPRLHRPAGTRAPERARRGAGVSVARPSALSVPGPPGRCAQAGRAHAWAVRPGAVLVGTIRPLDSPPPRRGIVRRARA